MPKRATLPEANDVLIGRSKGTLVPDTTAAVPQEKKSMVVKKQPTKVRKSEKTSISEVLKEETPLVLKSESTKEENIQKSKDVKMQISTYLTEKTLKRLEEVKYRLYAEHDVRAKKSDIIELALEEGLADPARLAHALRTTRP